MIIFIKHRIGTIAGLKHRFTHIVNEVVQMEVHQILGLSNPADGNGLVNHPGGTVSVAGGCNEAGAGRTSPIFFRQIALAQDHTADPKLQCPIHHVFLLSADHNGVLAGTFQAGTAGGQGDHHLAGNLVKHVFIIIDDAAFQGTEQVKDRYVFHHRILGGIHVAFRNAAGGDHAVQFAGFRGDRQGGNTAVGLNHFPCMADGHIGTYRRRTVKINVTHLGTHRG